jgi:oligopeptide/dipeptide ABC transporter ATP-binding protein
MPSSEHLVVEDVRVRFGRGDREREVIHGVSFDIPPGSSLGLIGESGSGKSLTCRSILRVLPPNAWLGGSVRFGDTDLTALSERVMRRYRGSRIGMVFQDPMTALNPVMRVGDSIAQVVEAHERKGRGRARTRAVEMMERVGILNAASRARDYPHQFSGGMRQRIVIAMALAARPSLLLADEPTTALDVITQAEILRLIDRLRRDEGMSLLLVSHDLGVVAGTCDRLGVMYAGELVEVGPTAEILASPRHPYTLGLLRSLPETSTGERLISIPGSPPDPAVPFRGCAFAPRCAFAGADCRETPIPLITVPGGRQSRCIHIDRLVESVHG